MEELQVHQIILSITQELSVTHEGQVEMSSEHMFSAKVYLAIQMMFFFFICDWLIRTNDLIDVLWSHNYQFRITKPNQSVDVRKALKGPWE